MTAGGLFDDLETSWAKGPRQGAVVALPVRAAPPPAAAPEPPPPDERAWTWSQHRRRGADSLHVRHDRGEVVIIARGGAAGSIGAGQGGVRLPLADAVALARFLANPEGEPRA
jgi:Na+-transporting NADH:ubiquinone oxidoreductase subunit NqrF